MNQTTPNQKRVAWKHLVMTMVLLAITSQNAMSALLAEYPVVLSFAVDETFSLNITLNNTLNETAYNARILSHPNLQSQRLVNVSRNSTGTLETIIIANQTNMSIMTLKLQYDTLVEYYREPTHNETLIITNESFVPEEISVVEGSIITFVNNDTVNRTILSNLFDQKLGPQQNYTYEFGEVGSYIVSDPFGDSATLITVLETHELVYVHDPGTDVTLNFQLNITSYTTTLEAKVLQPENNHFSLSVARMQKEGILRVINTGDDLARNVTLLNSWLQFDYEKFDLPVGELRLIRFWTNPSVSNDDLDRGLQKPLIVRASNAALVEINLTFFVNGTGYRNETVAEELRGLAEAMRAICRDHPELCSGEETVVEVEKVEYRDREFGVNYTDKDVYALQDSIRGLQNDFRVAQGAQNVEVNDLRGQISQNSELLGKIGELVVLMQNEANLTAMASQSAQAESEQLRSHYQVLLLAASVGIAVMLVVFGVLFLVSRVLRQRNPEI